jgi:hypothetical protein
MLTYATQDKSGVLDVNNISESMKSLGVHKNFDEVRNLLALLVQKYKC